MDAARAVVNAVTEDVKELSQMMQRGTDRAHDKAQSGLDNVEQRIDEQRDADRARSERAARAGEHERTETVGEMLEGGADAAAQKASQKADQAADAVHRNVVQPVRDASNEASERVDAHGQRVNTRKPGTEHDGRNIIDEVTDTVREEYDQVRERAADTLRKTEEADAPPAGFTANTEELRKGGVRDP